MAPTGLLLIGPDGLLYVSSRPTLFSSGLGGQVLQFNPTTGDFIKVFITDAGGGEVGHRSSPNVGGGVLTVTGAGAAPPESVFPVLLVLPVLLDGLVVPPESFEVEYVGVSTRRVPIG